MILDLGFLLLLTGWSLAVGRRVLARLDPTSRPPSEHLALSISLGLGVLGLGTLGLSAVGWLNRSSLVVLLSILTVYAAHDLRWRSFAWIGFTSRSHRASNPGRSSNSSAERPWLCDLGFLTLLALGIVGTLLTSLIPVTDGDALCYHLQVPKVFLAHGGAFYDPDLHETVYPLLTEMLYAVALAFRGPVACRLVQWLLGVVFVLNVVALARPSLGTRAWWAGSIAMLAPAISNGMSAPLNDVALASFGTAALVGWSGYQARPTSRSSFLAGTLTGLALGVKYPALVLAGLLGITVAMRGFLVNVPDRGPSRLADRWRASLVPLALFVYAALMTGGWWYLRAGVHTGNPVYPFFRQYFGGAGLDEVLDPRRKVMPVTLVNLLVAPALMTLQPQRFDSFSHQFGPLFLLFVPALLLEKAPRRVLGLVGLGYLFLMCCLSQRQSTRFVLITVAPFSVAVAWLAGVWVERRTWPSRLLVAFMLLGLTMEAGLAAARPRLGIGVLLGRESPEQFLTRREPTYLLGRWVDANLPPDARIVGQDHRGFYIPREYTMELAHRRRTGLGDSGVTPRAIVEHLKEQGFTHVLLCPPVPEDAVEFDPTLGRLLGAWLEDRGPVYCQTLADGDGVARRYSIYALTEQEAAKSAGSVLR